ncbi:SDR family oxidoreductase [Nemorincola caseinilytica]|uniref:SDR family oxidoreductase n=1 Tax=Nemorincola caseinilytica TaxID=2054315 RepID=A0ABP8N6R1_9BACT
MSANKKKTFWKELDVPVIRPGYKGTDKLKDRIAIITGGDSGIGRSVAMHFAREGADIAIVYLQSDGDAKETEELITAEGRQCLLLKGDLAGEAFCRKVVERTAKHFGRIDILVNNAGMHQEDKKVEGISRKQLVRTFEVNLFPFFYLCRFAMPHMPRGGCIINTASVVAYRGSEHLMDYSATKGAVVSFTRSLAKNLAAKKIRVNEVAPGPIWTPLVIEAFDAAHLKQFGKDTPMGRAGYPYEVAPAYVYLACDDSTYVTGQTLHVNGGDMVTG